MKLTPDTIKRLQEKGRYADGDGLYLQVAKNGTKTWIYRYQLNGKRREFGLGSIQALSLSKARAVCKAHKLKVKAGIDPIIEKEANIKAQEAEGARQRLRSITFEICAEEYMGLKEAEWSNAKHAQQWRNTLAQYAYPVIGSMPVEDIENQHILEILNPIWLAKTETATRVRNRIELVLDYAAALKYRANDNPARWRGNLDAILPRPGKVKKVKHHSAIPYDEIADFMADLAKQEGLAVKALMVSILTAARTSEVLEATWDEFNLDKKIWIIPAERMKAGKTHRIPLSGPVISLLEALKEIKRDDFVFPGMKLGKPLSNMSMALVLRRMDRADLTVHGFRSTFRDWIAERTNFPQRVAETALAHQLKDGAEAAYQRGDLLEKRKELMAAWADYCLPKKSNVRRIRA